MGEKLGWKLKLNENTLDISDKNLHFLFQKHLQINVVGGEGGGWGRGRQRHWKIVADISVEI